MAKPGTHVINTTEDPNAVGKYTKQDAGQRKFGGWTKDGLQKYMELVKLNKEGWKKATTPTLEDEILQRLREKHKIQEDNWAEYKRIKWGRNTLALVKEEIDWLFTDDEDEGIEGEVTQREGI